MDNSMNFKLKIIKRCEKMIQSDKKDTKINSIEEKNKILIHKFIDAYNNRELEIFEELVAPDYIDHTHQTRGRKDFKNLFTLAFNGFPDWYENIEEIIAEGENVWVRVIATGTHTGEWNLFGTSLLPTGNKVKMEMIFIWRIKNGKMIEGREVDDSLDFLRQLGVVEYTENGKKLFSELPLPSE
jgi:predicted ester cyclase